MSARSSGMQKAGPCFTIPSKFGHGQTDESGKVAVNLRLFLLSWIVFLHPGLNYVKSVRKHPTERSRTEQQKISRKGESRHEVDSKLLTTPWKNPDLQTMKTRIFPMTDSLHAQNRVQNSAHTHPPIEFSTITRSSSGAIGAHSKQKIDCFGDFRLLCGSAQATSSKVDHTP